MTLKVHTMFFIEIYLCCADISFCLHRQCFVIYIDALAKSGNAEKAQGALKRIETLMVKEKSFGINNYGYNLGK